jgi:hypothetical protein
MLRATVTTSWNKNLADEIATDVMKDLARKGGQRLRTVTCPVHGSTHQVTWESQGKNINVSVNDACCDKLQEVLNAEAEKAIQ